jgi:hypothetical protein
MRKLLVAVLVLGSCGGSLTAASPTAKLATYIRTTVVSGVFSPSLALSSNTTVFVALNKQDATGRDPSGSISALRPGMAQIESLQGSSGTGTVSALAVAPDQSLYFARTSNADPSTNRIFRYVDGVTSVVAGGGSSLLPTGRATSVALQGVVSLAFLPDRSIVAAEYGDNRILRIAPDGTISTVAGTGGCDGNLDPPTQKRALEIALCGPGPLAVDSSGTIYVAERERDWVLAVDVSGNVRVIAQKLGQVSALAVDKTGTLLVADLAGHRLVRLAFGNVDTVTTGLRSPRAIAVADSGDIYVSDDLAGEIVRLAPQP